MAYVGKKPVDVIDLTKSNSFDVTTSATIGGDLNISDKIIHSGDTNTAIRFPAADTVTIETSASERMRVTDAGKVGIGITSPEALTHIAGATADADGSLGSQSPQLIIEGGNNNNPFELGMDNSGATAVAFLQSRNKAAGAQFLALNPKGGTVMVGKTASDGGVVGFETRSTGETFAVASGTGPLYVHRLSDDGAVVTIQQGGSTDGQINSVSGDIGIGSGDTAFKFESSTNAIKPFNVTSNGARDNEISLGTSGARYDDAYIVNGVTTGSDQNEKQQIASLTSAEIAAAKRISNGFKTFKWNSAVTAKGDNARTHTGVIAQEVRTALEAEGLDATKYAFWCSDTWWEKDVDVAAVAAKDAVTRKHTDTDGSEIEEVVTPAVEAKDAYTRTDFYNTKDEAPEGATEKTRLGIRYPELLAFIGAATEQRLADIETRLTALEAG